MTTSLGITRISLSCSTSDDAAHTVCRHTDTEHRGPGGHRGEWQRERQDYAADQSHQRNQAAGPALVEPQSQGGGVGDRVVDQHTEGRKADRTTDIRLRPSMYRCATVSHLELEQLRRIRDIVRMGHVQRIEPTTIVLDGGSVPATPTALYIDCTADGAPQRPAKPVFDADHLTLQAVRGCQQVFSAAFIAHVEFAYEDDAVKNELCTPIPHPDCDLDWMRLMHSDLGNFQRWLNDPDLTDWLSSARLNLLADLLPPLSHKPRVRERVVSMFQKRLGTAGDQLAKLLDAATATTEQR